MTQREAVRLLVFFGLAAVITLVALFGLQSVSGEEGERNRLSLVIPEDKPPPEERQPLAEVKLDIPPWRPPRERLDELIREETPTDRVKEYPEALNLLAPLVRDRPQVNFRMDPETKEVGGFERVLATALADPARGKEFRARPVEVVGEVLSSTLVDPVAEYGLDPAVFKRPLLQGELKVDRQVVDFILLETEEEGRVLEIPFPGARHKVQGVFYRVRDVIPLGAAAPETRPLILAKKVVAALPLEVREDLPADLAGTIREIEDNFVTRSPHQDLAFFTLLGYVLGAGERAIPEGVEPILLRTRAPLERPDDYRLKPVRVRGQVVYLAYESFEYEEMRPEDAPILGYWHLIVSEGNPGAHVPISVVVPDKQLPPEITRWIHLPLDLRAKEPPPAVDFRGIYYRVHGFLARGTSKTGPQDVRMPLVISVGPLRLVPPPKETSIRDFMMVFLAIAAVLVVALVLMLWRDRSKASRMEEHIRQQRTRRRKSRGMDLNRELESRRAEPPSE